MFNYKGNTYRLTSTRFTWQQAQAEAQSLGGNLVTINSQEEQDWLVTTFGRTELWIGLTDNVTEGQFQWASGETYTYTNWFPGTTGISLQPDNGGPQGEDYVVMNFGANLGAAGKWNDYPSNNQTTFRGIIEISPSNNTNNTSNNTSNNTGNNTNNNTSTSTINNTSRTINNTGRTINGTSANDTLTGGAGNDSLNGGAGNDNLTGGDGHDTLDGGTGNDTLIGGAGNDIYFVDSTADIVTETLSTLNGIDTIQSSASDFTLLPNIENLTLIGTAVNGTGNIHNNIITGNSANNTLNGDAGNDTLNGGAGTDTLIGGLGDDTYVVDSTTDVIRENPVGGTDTIQSSASNFTLLPNIENLTLTGTAANGTGNTGNNTITGNSANNILNGGAGNDTLIGGAGNDIYVVDSTTDVITENPGGGTDTIQSSASNFTLLPNIENLTLIIGTAAINGTGNASNNVITGNGADNTLNGGDGNDTLDGGAGNDTLDGGAGTDILNGGTGNDTYVVTDNTDTITEVALGGTDTIQSSVNYTIVAANVENLTLIGTAVKGTGNAVNNTITGNSANNTLDGGAGTDILNGNDGDDTLDGGAGDDILIGGTGNDTYVVDSPADTITETNNLDTDTVESSVTFSIGNFAEVENLTLTGTTAINGTGNAVNNTITGNSANNILDGGAGDDTLIGGAGDDIYVVDSLADIITENPDAGIDTVRSSVDYTIANFADVDNLILIGTAINGTGNARDNTITGNSADNILDGGAGIDTLIGNLGDDTYRVDNIDDIIIENPLEGIDTVESSVSFSIADFADVENLILIGTNDTDAIGNDDNNTITGNSGKNTLKGGLGNDSLVGGGGDDTYIFTIDGIGLGTDTITGGSGVDTISFAGTSANIRLNLGIPLQTVDVNTKTKVELTVVDAIENAIGGDGNDRLTGNSKNNTLEGGLGNDILRGGDGNDILDGGDGNDVLWGGADDDQFVFTGKNPFNTTDNGVDIIGVDIIADFTTGTDKLVLSKTVFDFLSSVVGTGLSVPSDFASVNDDELAGGSSATIVYSLGSGSLFYNQDGATAGFGTGGEFAVLGLLNLVDLTASDFVIIA
jgi:Ca2+-binding RTX toxin-like protein